MAWQQQQGGYDNYGGYVDTGYGQNDQQNQQYYGGPTTGMVRKWGKFLKNMFCTPPRKIVARLFSF